MVECCRGSGQVIRWRAALARQQRFRTRAKQLSFPARACAATPLVAAIRLRFCQTTCVQRQECRRIQKPQGEGFSIVRRFLSLSLWLSMRLGALMVINCKVPEGGNCFKNHRFTRRGRTPDA
jgi:hypothetical protein